MQLEWYRGHPPLHRGGFIFAITQFLRRNRYGDTPLAWSKSLRARGMSPNMKLMVGHTQRNPNLHDKIGIWTHLLL
ncbi:MAG TPA: hypothetical protein DC024_05200 [Clostridiales bacterium]|nr:hypothetical protein [Clostridiales bacterium]